MHEWSNDADRITVWNALELNVVAIFDTQTSDKNRGKCAWFAIKSLLSFMCTFIMCMWTFIYLVFPFFYLWWFCILLLLEDIGQYRDFMYGVWCMVYDAVSVYSQYFTLHRALCIISNNILYLVLISKPF